MNYDDGSKPIQRDSYVNKPICGEKPINRRIKINIRYLPAWGQPV